jgi:superfamily II DNA or RNA helicase
MESIVKYTDATETKIQYVKPTAIALDANASFYVVNAINICKKSEKFWSPIKFLIVDELHQIITKVLSKSLFRIVPRYVLGLSATPYRFDEYQQAIAWFFGSTIIGKDLYVRHTVYRLMTGFKPLKVKYTTKGVDWNSVLEEQSENDDRNELIVSTIIELNKRPTSCGRTWMILVKRVAHAETLVEKFAKYGVACTTLLRSAVEFDKSCKILIGTTSKIGVGFDHAAIDALCIAADVKNYFVQFLGRCMRRPDAYPIVLDLEDDFTSLKRHFDGRVSEYKKHGGRILPFV